MIANKKGNICLGVDLVDLTRFKRKLTTSPRVLEELFSRVESRQKSTDHLAGVFAAKEAITKALGLAPGSWLQMEIHHTSGGKPTVKFAGHIDRNLQNYDLSIAHDGNSVVAVFVALQKDG